MLFTQVSLALLLAIATPLTAKPLSPSVGKALLAAAAEVQLTPSSPLLEKRACRYGSCDNCYNQQTQCKNFNNNPDCLSCALSW